MEKKERNIDRLQEIADIIGDVYLTEMFWDMFSDLSLKNQEYYISRAQKIRDEELGAGKGDSSKNF